MMTLILLVWARGIKNKSHENGNKFTKKSPASGAFHFLFLIIAFIMKSGAQERT